MATEPPAEWEVELTLDPEVTKVRKWREEQLRAAGFSDFSSFRLSMVPDWHRAADLLAKTGDELFVVDQLID